MRFSVCSTVAMMIAISTQYYNTSYVQCSEEGADLTTATPETVVKTDVVDTPDVPDSAGSGNSESLPTKYWNKAKEHKKVAIGVGALGGVALLALIGTVVGISIAKGKKDEGCEEVAEAIERAVEQAVDGSSDSPADAPAKETDEDDDDDDDDEQTDDSPEEEDEDDVPADDEPEPEPEAEEEVEEEEEAPPADDGAPEEDAADADVDAE